MSPDHQETVQRWADGARDAFDTAERLFESRKFHHALFFCHLAVEKALKARYIAATGEMPPYTHDLRRLTLLAASAHPDVPVLDPTFLAELTTFNVAGRYQEDKLQLYHRATPEYTSRWIERTRSLIQTLLS